MKYLDRFLAGLIVIFATFMIVCKIPLGMSVNQRFEFIFLTSMALLGCSVLIFIEYIKVNRKE